MIKPRNKKHDENEKYYNFIKSIINRRHRDEYIIISSYVESRRTCRKLTEFTFTVKHIGEDCFETGICNNEFELTVHFKRDLKSSRDFRKSIKYEIVCKNIILGLHKARVFDKIKNTNYCYDWDPEFQLLGWYYDKNAPYNNNVSYYRHLPCGSIQTNSKECLSCTKGMWDPVSDITLEQKVKNKLRKNYKILGQYPGTKSYAILHESCGLITPKSISSLLKNEKICPACNKGSEGEVRIALYLDLLNLEYKREITEYELKNEPVEWPSRRYDFCVKHNNHLYVIEFDGKQHFIDIPHFKMSLEDQQEIDKEKTDLINSLENCSLLRIPYTEINNIPKLIDDFIFN